MKKNFFYFATILFFITTLSGCFLSITPSYDKIHLDRQSSEIFKEELKDSIWKNKGLIKIRERYPIVCSRDFFYIVPEKEQLISQVSFFNSYTMKDISYSLKIYYDYYVYPGNDSNNIKVKLIPKKIEKITDNITKDVTRNPDPEDKEYIQTVKIPLFHLKNNSDKIGISSFNFPRQPEEIETYIKSNKKN